MFSLKINMLKFWMKNKVLKVQCHALSKDGRVLLDVKRSLVDQYGALSNWNASDRFPCNWDGVYCSNSSTSQPRRVWDLNLPMKNLSGSIAPSIGRLTALRYFNLSNNKLYGPIPSSIGNLSKLVFLDLTNNLLTGQIPPEFGRASNLVTLDLSYNQLTGTIPVQMQRLRKLMNVSIEILTMSGNNFTGSLPEELGQLSKLTSLSVANNALTGNIPLGLGKCLLLEYLDLSNNQFTGGLPTNFGNFLRLESLLASDNQLSGSIPDTLSSCVHLLYLQLGANRFSGSIPPSLGTIHSLQYGLNLSHNALTGNIPPELGNLLMLQLLDLSFNSLIGDIPSALGNLVSIQIFNVSYNQLSGPVPNSSIFQRLNASSFVGNAGLCGGNLPNQCPPASKPLAAPLPPDSWQDSNVGIGVIVGIIAAVIAGAVLIILAGACWFYQRARAPVEQNPLQDNSDICFPQTGLTLTLSDIIEATDNFSDSAEIGRGACGKVYKAQISSELVLAVKKLSAAQKDSPVDHDSFTAEIMTLGQIRHRNIVKLLGFCSHQDFNLLLYEYMAKGSLGELLGSETCSLDWDLRYKVALGAAEGLAYLHHDCKPHIIHRDIKSNNILLDAQFETHVGDFGLAKLIVQGSKSMSTIAGTYGYIAPEYAYTTKVTEKCDIYSFGVVLLELLTGRRPVQPIESGGDLVTWVKEAMNSNPVTEILDSRMELSDSVAVDEMKLMLKIALYCTDTVPISRPSMRKVVWILSKAYHRFLTNLKKSQNQN
ncbi:unnamed protein product [Sphagnum jensenii]|uniref:Protein kinase domain-containing protein n=1 Tax=Sphagnum jensenii TaxID=128206 RepID=A0ABP1B1J4_9BRYO